MAWKEHIVFLAQRDIIHKAYSVMSVSTQGYPQKMLIKLDLWSMAFFHSNKTGIYIDNKALPVPNMKSL